VKYQAIVAIRVRSPQILAQVEALQIDLSHGFAGSAFRSKIQPVDSLHITLAQISLTVEELER
jgi:hypothetical protein